MYVNCQSVHLFVTLVIAAEMAELIKLISETQTTLGILKGVRLSRSSGFPRNITTDSGLIAILGYFVTLGRCLPSYDIKRPTLFTAFVKVKYR